MHDEGGKGSEADRCKIVHNDRSGEEKMGRGEKAKLHGIPALGCQCSIVRRGFKRRTQRPQGAEQATKLHTCGCEHYDTPSSCCASNRFFITLTISSESVKTISTIHR